MNSVIADLLARRGAKKVRRLPDMIGAVRRDSTPIMRQRGWQRDWRGVWRGWFATKEGTWAGEIQLRGDRYRVYIKMPPVNALSRHSKWPCFIQLGSGSWWEINLAISPIDNDANAIVIYVERVLRESFRLAGGNRT